MSDAKTDPAAPKKSGKTLLIALVGLLLVGGGGAGAWFVFGNRGDGHAQAEKKHEAKPLFITLDPFTVNLVDPRGERFAQIGVTLQVEDPALEMKIKDRLPAVRNDILLLIASRQLEELLSPEGKRKLAQDIRTRTAQSLGIEVAEAEDRDARAAAPGAQALAGKDGKDGKDGKAGEGHDEAGPGPAPRASKGSKKAARVAENPIHQVLFSQFIVQ